MINKSWLDYPRRGFICDIYQVTSIVRIGLWSIYKIVFKSKYKVLINIYIVNLNKRKIIEWLNNFFWQILIHINNRWHKWTYSFIGNKSSDSKVHFVFGIWIIESLYRQIIRRSCCSIDNTWEITNVIS